MSYTIAAQIKDKQTHEKMLKFLDENYRHPDELIYVSDPKPDLGYDHGELIIGFDYKSSEDDESWAWAVTKWIATVAGAVKKFENIDQPIQYLRLDGDYMHIPITHRAVQSQEDILPKHLKEKLEELKRKWMEQNQG